MEFFIRQGASDPILKMRMIDDGKNDKSSFNDLLENADITFEMYDVKTDIPYILNESCNITTRTKLYNQTTDEYYITYRFTESQTSEVGKYEGKVIIQFKDDNGDPTNKLILPVKEKLFINIF
jgi:uncharacterized protein YuzE